MKARLAIIIMALGCLGPGPRRLFSASPTASEEARRWVGAKFLGQPPLTPDQGYLLVYIRRGGLDRNSVKGKPLLIGTHQFKGGLHFSAGKVVVHLPRAAQTLEAVVGADGNRDDLGFGGRGSFVLSVNAQGSELYHSKVMHEGMDGVPIHVNLNGAKEFTLELKPVGAKNPWDSLLWDQADWAEARVTLEDGGSVALADLPSGPLPSPYTVEPPFAFRYGDVPSSVLLKTWEFSRTERRLDSNRTQYVLTYRDPRTDLVVRCEAIAYADFPTVEWIVYFKNEGMKDTPILEQIQALDTGFERGPEGEFMLHHANGGHAEHTDFEPLETPLGPRANERLAAGTGRATDKHLCYFNVQWPGQVARASSEVMAKMAMAQGVIIGLGWPGDWAAQFTRDEGRELRVRAGQELTHFKLLPGEEVRGPLVALQFYDGDWISAQNVWRRWMMAHNLPRIDGKLPPFQLAAEPGVVTDIMQDANEQNMRALLDRYLEERIPLDYWWMDAGCIPSRRTGRKSALGTPTRSDFPTDSSRSPITRTARGFSPSSGLSRSGLLPERGSMKTTRNGCWGMAEETSCSTWGIPTPGTGWWSTSARKSKIKGLISTARISILIRFPSGGRTTRRTGRGSRKSGTSPGTSPTGMNCGGAFPACVLTPAPAAAAATISKPCAAPSPCGAATTFGPPPPCRT